MLHIALVSYINTRPFMDGFEHAFGPEEVSLHLLPPAQCAVHLAQKQSQLALIPVGAIPDFEQIELMPDYCIGANGPVESVYILSQCPIEEVNTLILDRHSRSSNGLARILLHHYWKREVNFVYPSDKHFHLIKEKTAGVVIGDKAIKIRHAYRYHYDLAWHWKMLTGLPFVFAVWGCHPSGLSEAELGRLNRAMQWGIGQAGKSAEKWADYFRIPRPFAKKYLEQCIDFHFDAPKHQALSLYLRALKELPQLVMS
ncbi:MAG: hypothetical protein D6730_08660 [Bacteroidetes bacterium]|nr:MAG: hypothetical protein D6730_08660 [Bacteroidota bacterium]